MILFRKFQAQISPQLALAAGVYALALVLFVGSYALVRWDPFGTKPDTVLGAYSQGEILSTVAGVEGPAVLTGGTVQLGINRCTHADQVIEVEVTIGFRNMTPGGTPPTVSYLANAIQQRLPGCNFALIPIPLPAMVTPGTWRIEGVSRAVETSELRYWVSEEFLVIEQR